MSHRFGIEIELPKKINGHHVYSEDLYDIVRDALRTTNSQHSVEESREDHREWNVKEDCSCGYEITSPAILITEHDLEHTEEIIKAIYQGLQDDYEIGNVDKHIPGNCGLHIHISKNMIPPPLFNRLIRFYYHFEPVLFSKYFPSRVGNEYATSIRKTLHRDTKIQSNDEFLKYNFYNDNNFNDNHYTAINCEKRHTIEFRYFYGTVNETKIINWLSFIIMSIYASGIKYCNFPFGWEVTTKEDLKRIIEDTPVDNWKYIIKNRALDFIEA